MVFGFACSKFITTTSNNLFLSYQIRIEAWRAQRKKEQEDKQQSETASEEQQKKKKAWSLEDDEDDDEEDDTESIKEEVQVSRFDL